MNVLITGHRGFLGREFTRQLTDAGHDVAGVDVKPWASGDPKTMQGHTLDVRAWCSSQSTYAQKVKYDLVIHLAESETDSMASKMEVDAALWDWIGRTGQKRVLYVSSAAVYPRSRSFLVTEEDVSYPETADGWVKFMGEKLAAEVQADCRVTVCRLFGVYGQGASGYIGRLFENYSRPSPVPVIVENELLSLLHVEDAVKAMLACEASVLKGLEIFNVGGEAINTRELIARLRVGMEPVEVLWSRDGGEIVGRCSPCLKKLGGHFERTINLISDVA